eukprot:TRINITY_DN11363_c0_g1_i1.p1 TRINITY_DN11363_c0_g1~~TRINITY_DN11363_c0_g1_i1.p1  ORF type:complete len:262 (-),score=25.46 TRINITY_DN11363_c0_g1_i1:394-1179(-)
MKSDVKDIPLLPEFIEQCMQINLEHLSNFKPIQVPTRMASGKLGGIEKGIYQRPELTPLSSVDDWQARFRLGMLQLLQSKRQMCRAVVPATMYMDILRLHNIQNELQRVVVLSFCMMLVKQHCTTLSDEELSVVRDSINEALSSGGPVRESLLQEIASVVGEEKKLGIEKSLDALLLSDSGAYKAVVSKVSQVLQLLVLYGPQNVVAPQVQGELTNKLNSLGGDILQQDFVSVGKSMGEVMAIQERIYGNIYSTSVQQSRN